MSPNAQRSITQHHGLNALMPAGRGPELATSLFWDRHDSLGPPSWWRSLATQCSSPASPPQPTRTAAVAASGCQLISKVFRRLQGRAGDQFRALLALATSHRNSCGLGAYVRVNEILPRQLKGQRCSGLEKPVSARQPPPLWAMVSIRQWSAAAAGLWPLAIEMMAITPHRASLPQGP